MESVDEGAVVERIAKFAIENFQLRKCKRYVKMDLESEEKTGPKKTRLFKPDDCSCGRSVQWHIKEARNSPATSGANTQPLRTAAIDGPEGTEGTKWSVVGDTVLCQCDSYGELFFVPGEGLDPSAIIPGASAKYIRLSGDAEMQHVYNLLISKQLWGLPLPQLIIEVAGTKPKKSVYIDKDVLERFNDGIIKAANAANAWFVTGGTNTGIMGLVGDAVAKSRTTSKGEGNGITCLGITPFGIVNHRDQLINFDMDTTTLGNQESSVLVQLNVFAQKNGGSKTEPDVDVLLENWTTCYTVDPLDSCKNGVPLNPGHDCFLLVDNGLQKRYGEENDFRNRFLHFMSHKALNGISGTGGSSRTPVVLLVVGGSINTLETVEQAVSSKQYDINNDQPDENDFQNHVFSRPVVLLSGLFWGASDLLSFAYQTTKPVKDLAKGQKSDESKLPTDFDERIKHHAAFDYLLTSVPEANRKDEANRTLSLIKKCLKFRSMITVVNLLDDHLNTFDSALLDAFFKSNVGSPCTTFELAQLWDRVDIAKQLLRQHGEEIRESVNMKQALTRAILHGQAEFVKLLTRDGYVDLNSYLTISQLKGIYYEMFVNQRGKPGKSSSVRLFRSLMMRESMHDSQLTTIDFLDNIGDMLSNLLGCYLDNVFTDEKHFKAIRRSGDFSKPGLAEHRLNEPYPTNMRDIFIFQLLVHRSQLADYFFRAGHDHIGTALMATIFLKSLSKEAERLDMTDLAIAYEEQSNEWQERAIHLLSSCYEHNPMVCGQLLKRSLVTWQGLTVMEMAYYGDRKQLMEQPAVQTVLGQAWLGKMASFTRPILIYMTLIPPLLPFLIFRIHFEDRSSTRKAERKTPSMKANGKIADFMTERGRSITQSDLQEIARSSTSSSPPRRMLPVSSFAKPQRDNARLSRVSLLHPSRKGSISIFRAAYHLYASPMAKYATHTFVLACFLLVFSFLVLDGLHRYRVTGVEIIIWLCCAIYFLDNVRMTFGQTHLSLLERLEDFFFNVWVMADLLGFIVVVSAIIMRFILVEGDEIYPHTIYAVACVIYWLKSLRIFFVTEAIGPKVFTLFQMMKDVTFFVLIYVILLLSFSMPIYALLYPNRDIDSPRVFFALLLDISYERMWNIFVVTMDNSRAIVEGTCRLSKADSNPSVLVNMQQTVRSSNGKEVRPQIGAQWIATPDAQPVADYYADEIIQTKFEISRLYKICRRLGFRSGCCKYVEQCKTAIY